MTERSFWENYPFKWIYNHTQVKVKMFLFRLQSERFLHRLTEFAGENGMSAGPLRALMKSVLLLPHGKTFRTLSLNRSSTLI